MSDKKPTLRITGAGTPLPSPNCEPRMFFSEVCAISKLSRQTVRRRIEAGLLPKPVDRGREMLFDRRAIYAALGIGIEAENHEPEENPWMRGARIFAEKQAARLRRDRE